VEPCGAGGSTGLRFSSSQNMHPTFFFEHPFAGESRFRISSIEYAIIFLS
jgi:hypothetical protein